MRQFLHLFLHHGEHEEWQYHSTVLTHCTPDVCLKSANDLSEVHDDTGITNIMHNIFLTLVTFDEVHHRFSLASRHHQHF